jgi:hypothetical protein
MNTRHLLWFLFFTSCRFEASGSGEGDPPLEPPLGPPDLESIPAPCAEELERFAVELERPILQIRCFGCHQAEGIAKSTRMVLDGAGTPAATLHNYRAAALVARAELAERPVLLLKPTLLHPSGHTGGRLIADSGPEYAALTRFVEGARNDRCDAEVAPPLRCTEPEAGRRLLRRLSRVEYDHTVEALLGVDSRHGIGFPADPARHGFENAADDLWVSPLLADRLREAAESLATQALTNPERILPCAPANGDEACARQFLERFGRRAFRRPLSAVELERYLTLYRGAANEGFLPGIELVLTALLQSPHFLYRAEVGVAEAGSGYVLTPFERATELAYLVTGGPPDDTLLDRAAAGELDPAGLEAELERLLGTPAAVAQFGRFVDGWLDLSRLETVPKDTTTYPQLDPVLRAKLRQETEHLIAAVWSEDGTLSGLLTAPYSYADDALLAYYGLSSGEPAGPDGFKKVQAGLHRGLLTQGSLLTVHARPNSGSPVHRGKLIRERFFCQALPPPPPGVNAEPPRLDPNLSTRERYLAHSQNEPCQGCHRLIDPIGFGFEAFDGIGRLRDNDGGRPVDASGEIVGTTQSNGTFSDLAGLADKLAASPDVRDCYAQTWVQFAYGLDPHTELACTEQQIRGAFTGDLKGLYRQLIAAPHFLRRGGVLVDPDPDPDPDPQPDPEPDPPPSTDVTFETRRDSDWGAGYCEAVTVLNGGTERVVWEIAIQVEGTLQQHWNATPSTDRGEIHFGGADWNRELGPDESTNFGFCALR